MLDSVHKLMYSRPVCSFYRVFFLKNDVIFKVHSAATPPPSPTCRGGVNRFVCLTQAVNGQYRCKYDWLPLGVGVGAREVLIANWILGKRDEGWTCGVVISEWPSLGPQL